MLIGVHVVIYTKDAEADRAFFQNILGFRSVDAGHGWMIFGVPAAEVAFHPHDQNNKHEMFFICDDLKTEVAALEKRGVRFGEISEERWGSRTKLLLPGGGEVALYEPKHPIALEKPSKTRRVTSKTKRARRR
jgi:catechol 2,3-dioxygenase-like lactoylglutathione lyase family enzyme